MYSWLPTLTKEDVTVLRPIWDIYGASSRGMSKKPSPIGDTIVHPLTTGRVAWLQVVQGAVCLHGQLLSIGDGAAISAETQLTLQGAATEATMPNTEILLFDMAA